ncbi:sensor histidine kinase [Bifidobacterium platyrrhinorum]|uniref:histidine kinase n=1 Tax=Bifidobacterium platyrrhinorum TaxID=2661628 RepID=A0A6L9SQ78_9BIFI|nr:histidine kinase [Bifidobacterium platyrrhinorum]NEG54707.1 histidine kinase [Bifidobacterium platyrrhinorum]
MGRIVAWGRSHVLAVDALLALAMAAFCLLLASGTDPGTVPALLFPTTMRAMRLWSIVILMPATMRRWRPEMASWLFVALCVAHLVFGPAVTYADLVSLPMLYSALLYGDPRHTPRFVVAAFSMGALVSGVWAFAFNLGPLFDGADGWSAWPPTRMAIPAMPTCRSSTSGVFGAQSTSCAGGIAIDTVILFLLVSACLVSVIIMAFWQRARLATLRAIRERNESIAAREVEETRIARLAERARIARDMHDVVAHTLSTIIVQSDGGRYAGAHDLAVAKRTMTTIRREAAHARRDMHRLFDVFGGSAGTGYADIPDLFDGHPPVARHVDGDARPDRLSPDADTAVFRLVQESLSNVRKHAGDGARVTMDETWGSDALGIVIHDDGMGASSAVDGHAPGYGLVGMRERIVATGGDVEAGPSPAGGFTVAATVPLLPDRRPTRVNSDDSARSDDAVPAALSKLHADLASLRSRLSGIDVDADGVVSGGAAGMTRIGRMAWWTERHYLFMDMLTAALLTLMFHTATFNDSGLASATFASLPARRAVAVAVTAALLAPYAFRRRFPESAALAMAVMSAVELLFAPSTLAVNVFALASVYSAVLYGRDSAWRWVLGCAAFDSLLFGARVVTGRAGYDSLVQALLQGDGGEPAWEVTLGGLLGGGMVLLVCLACMAMAEWRRSSGSDVLVLRQREEALRAEEDRRKVLAANMERERIGAAMRSEVAATLGTVIDRADEGLAMLDGTPVPSPERIAASFSDIGAQGREALARMRKLLAVLRETGFSDKPHEHAEADMLLTPMAPLSDQLDDQLDRRPNGFHRNRSGRSD